MSTSGSVLDELYEWDSLLTLRSIMQIHGKYSSKQYLTLSILELALSAELSALA